MLTLFLSFLSLVHIGESYISANHSWLFQNPNTPQNAHHHQHQRRLASPPQPVDQATGDLRVIFVRMDFSDWVAEDQSGQLGKWTSDEDIKLWIGGTTKPNEEFRAFYEVSSYHRLHLAKPLIIHPGVVRAPSTSTSFTQTYQYWGDVKALVETNTGPITNQDLVILLWLCKEFVEGWLNVPGADGLNTDAKKQNVANAIAAEISVDPSRVSIVCAEDCKTFIVYHVAILNDDSDALTTSMTAIGQDGTSSNTAVKNVIQTNLGSGAFTMVETANRPVNTKCASLPHLGWAGSASPRGSTAPAMFALNGFNGCMSCSTGLLRHELSHALGNGPHPGAYYPPADKSRLTPAKIAGANRCQTTPYSDCYKFSEDLYSPISWPSLAGSAQNTAAQKWLWGFINSNEVNIVPASSTAATQIRIMAHDLGGPVDMNAAINLPQVPGRALAAAFQSNVDEETYIWLEHRHGYKRTWGGSPSAAVQLDMRKKGVVIRIAVGPASTRTYAPMLIDATPETSTHNDAPLATGKTFNIPEHGLFIRVVCFSVGVQMPFVDVVVKKSAFTNGEYPSTTMGCVNGTDDIAGDGTGNGNSGEDGSPPNQIGECTDGSFNCDDTNPKNNKNNPNGGNNTNGTINGNGSESGAGLAVGLTFLFLFLIAAGIGGYYYYVNIYLFNKQNSTYGGTSSKRVSVLPPGWEKHLDDDQTPYYYNTTNEHTSYTYPGKAAKAGWNNVSKVDGWEMAIDEESGEAYYYHEESGITQWEPPMRPAVGITQTKSSPALPTRPNSVEMYKNKGAGHHTHRHTNKNHGTEKV